MSHLKVIRTEVNSYNKSQQDALFLNFILVKNYMFRRDLLSIISSLNTVFTAIGICHTGYVDGLLARSGWNCAVNKVLRLLMMDSKSVRNM